MVQFDDEPSEVREIFLMAICQKRWFFDVNHGIKRIQSIYHGTIPIVVSIAHHNARSNVAFSFVL